MLKANARVIRGALLLVAASLAPTSVLGHAVVLESSVAQDARLAHAPEAITLRLNGRIEHALNRITIERQGSAAIMLECTPTGPDRITVRMPPLRDGTYVLRYRVLAADGHVTEGALRFYITAASATVQ